MLEREVKLGAPQGFALPDLANLTPEAVAADSVTEKYRTTYFDTRDLRLTRWGVSMRYRTGQGWTVKLPGPAPADGALLVRGEHAFVGASDTPPAEAIDLLTAYLRRAHVQPVVHLRTTRTLVTIGSPHGEPLAEAVHDDVAVLDGRRIADRFREIEVEVKESAPEGLLEALLARLHLAGAGEPDPTPKVVRALGHRAARAPEVDVEELSAEATAGAVLRRGLSLAVIKLVRADAGVRLGVDPEEVHQARVAVRRLRSHLRTFLPLMDIEWATSLRQELGWLADELGAVRDTDVLLERMRKHAARLSPRDRPAGAKIIAMLAAQRDGAMAALAQTVRSSRYVDLLKRLVDAAHAPQLAPIAAEPALLALPPLAASLWRNVRSMVDGFGPTPPDDQLHKLRIRTKRCRYAAESVAPVAGKRAAAFARCAAALQEVLGEHQDAVVAARWLREHAVTGPLTFVAGQFTAWEVSAAEESRAAWPEAWRAFDRKKLRIWM